MELSIRTRGIDLTDEIKDLIAHRLELALDTFGGRVEGASVYIIDLNGTKGGVDKLCQITARVRGLGNIAVRESGLTLRDALTRTTRRLKYRLLKETHVSRSSATIRRLSTAA